MLHGLTQLNVELTSRCDKRTLCGFCGHQDPSIYPTIRFGEIKEELVKNLAFECYPLGKSLVVQFHRDGDPLAASDDCLCGALFDFRDNIRSIVTHGERLAERAQDLIEKCEAITVSIFRRDPDRDVQLTALRAFLKEKQARLPNVVLKVVGDMSDGELDAYEGLDLPIIRRRLHVPFANSKYAHGAPSMPEHGVCLDLLHHPSVAWDGRVYLCNRLDTHDDGLIGDLNANTLDTIWNGALRASYVQAHVTGLRATVPPCTTCTYYGIPAA